MAKIRQDLEGIIVIGDLKLRAGDTIPAGITVGDHLVEKEARPKAGKGSAAAKKATPAKK